MFNKKNVFDFTWIVINLLIILLKQYLKGEEVIQWFKSSLSTKVIWVWYFF
jgi:hypothetical protein